MYTKVKRRAFGIIAVFAFSLSPSVVLAQKPESTKESPAELAQQVYATLLTEYRGGETGVAQLELLNNWSIRILLADLISAELGNGLAAAEIAQQAMQRHFVRMGTLVEIVNKKVEAGLVSKSDLIAAKYFHRLNTSIEQMVKQIQQQLRPLEIKLPEAESKPLLAKNTAIVIDIDATGKCSVKGKELTLDQLEKQFRKIAKDDPQSEVSIRAHPDCIYANVVRVLSVCGKSGLSISFTSVEFKSEDN